jgi:hypothetical protein
MRLLILLPSFLLCHVFPAMGETYVVDPHGTGDFPTIQAAVNAVQDGDVILLTDGLFTGDGNRDIDYHGKRITIRSQSGNPEACIVDCQASPNDQHRGFNFHSDETRSSVLEGVSIHDAYHSWGGGIRCSDCAPTIRRCIFYQNHGDGEGGGIYICDGSRLLLEDCLFLANDATSGGGISYCYGYGDTPEIVRCTFVSNSAVRGGGVRY